MAKILIHSDSASSATSVSNIFIDEYMSCLLYTSDAADEL